MNWWVTRGCVRRVGEVAPGAPARPADPGLARERRASVRSLAVVWLERRDPARTRSKVRVPTTVPVQRDLRGSGASDHRDRHAQGDPHPGAVSGDEDAPTPTTVACSFMVLTLRGPKSDCSIVTASAGARTSSAIPRVSTVIAISKNWLKRWSAAVSWIDSSSGVAEQQERTNRCGHSTTLLARCRPSVVDVARSAPRNGCLTTCRDEAVRSLGPTLIAVSDLRGRSCPRLFLDHFATHAEGIPRREARAPLVRIGRLRYRRDW